MRVDLRPRSDEYWDWAAVALFLLLTVDLLTSMYAADVAGIEHEANPLMAWLLGQSLLLIVAVHVVAIVLAAAFFYALFEVVRELPETYRGPPLSRSGSFLACSSRPGCSSSRTT